MTLKGLKPKGHNVRLCDCLHCCPPRSIKGCLWLPGGQCTVQPPRHLVPHTSPVSIRHHYPAVSDRHPVPPDWCLYLLTLKDNEEDILSSTHLSHSHGRLLHRCTFAHDHATSLSKHTYTHTQNRDQLRPTHL